MGILTTSQARGHIKDALVCLSAHADAGNKEGLIQETAWCQAFVYEHKTWHIITSLKYLSGT
jgi:hypothetical protein